jgi:hypothetical protein
MTLLEKLYRIIARDNCGMTITEGHDPRFGTITYHDVQGTDTYKVEYFDGSPQRISREIGGRWRHLTNGDAVAPW